LKIGVRKALFDRSCKDLYKRIDLEVDGKLIDLPPVEGIVILNLLRFAKIFVVIYKFMKKFLVGVVAVIHGVQQKKSNFKSQHIMTGY
jgi:hypothetical protein